MLFLVVKLGCFDCGCLMLFVVVMFAVWYIMLLVRVVMCISLLMWLFSDCGLFGALLVWFYLVLLMLLWLVCCVCCLLAGCDG